MKGALHMTEPIVKDMQSVKHFIAGDECQIAEILHPYREKLPFDCLSIAHAFMEPGTSTKNHVLKGSSEVYICISGSADLFINGAASKLTQGVCALVPPGAEQHVENGPDERLEFLCVVTPPWSAENEVIL